MRFPHTYALTVVTSIVSQLGVGPGGGGALPLLQALLDPLSV